MGTILQIPVPKAGTGVTVPIDIDDIMGLPDESLREILFQGAKVVLNRGQSKDVSSKGMEGAAAEANREKILTIVQAQWELAKAGKLRASGGKATKAEKGAVRVEAMRDARERVKLAMKRAAMRVSDYTAKQITQAAEYMLEGENGPAILEQARLVVEQRSKVKEDEKIDLSMLKPDPELVKKNDAKTKKKKGTAAEIAAAVSATTKGKPAGFSLRH